MLALLEIRKNCMTDSSALRLRTLKNILLINVNYRRLLFNALFRSTSLLWIRKTKTGLNELEIRIRPNCLYISTIYCIYTYRYTNGILYLKHHASCITYLDSLAETGKIYVVELENKVIKKMASADILPSNHDVVKVSI